MRRFCRDIYVLRFTGKMLCFNDWQQFAEKRKCGSEDCLDNFILLNHYGMDVRDSDTELPQLEGNVYTTLYIH